MNQQTSPSYETPVISSPEAEMTQQTSLSYETPVTITASEILLSEDYTRVTRYGKNPRITHIFYDFRLEWHPSELIISFGKKREEVMNISSVLHQVAATFSACPSCDEFLNSCEACNKNLKEGAKMYIYRDRLPFCSNECLAVGILAEEITKVANNGINGILAALLCGL